MAFHQFGRGDNWMKKLFFAFLLFLFAVSCAKYKAVSIPQLQPEFSPNAQKQKDVTAVVKVFSIDDCKRYFDSNLIDEGYQPIQLMVDNQSKLYYLLSKSGISLPTVPPEEVAQKAHRSTVGRATGYGIAAIFIWPFLIPAIVDASGSSKANTQMDIDFTAKGLDDIVIQPYSRAQGVIFVPTSEMQPNLTVNIIDKETNEKIEFTFTNIK